MLTYADVTQKKAVRALSVAYVKEGRMDWARCCFEMLALLGVDNREDRAFLKAHPAPVLKPDDPYAGTIEDSDRGRYLSHPEARVMTEVFASIYEGLPGVGGPTLDGLGVSVQDKVSPISELDIGKIYGQTSKALGNRRANLYVDYDPKFQGVVVVGGPPPSIVIDQHLATDVSVAEMRFLLGRALELARPEYILVATLPGKDFAQLFASVLKAFHPRHARWRPGAEGAEQVTQLKKALPYKVSKRLAELFQENQDTPFSSARFRSVVHETGNRAGLLMCGDMATAARLVLAETVPELGPTPDVAVMREHARKEGPLRDLLRYALSPEYFSLRQALGTGVTKAAAA